MSRKMYVAKARIDGKLVDLCEYCGIVLSPTPRGDHVCYQLEEQKETKNGKESGGTEGRS